MQKSPNLKKLLPLKSSVLHRRFKAVQITDQLKSLRNHLFKIVNKLTEVMYELLTQDGEIFHAIESVGSILS